ncbi:uncharacterized protein LOC115972957 [Quercus lobata]|uniref:uncharacterized protein LOC115972957 n=1 Tax=Quercus lobata TaxID=97700 RepID=UPI00124926EC|nr:uncharacterized protein LOC115972957 [Quercus lobata]
MAGREILIKAVVQATPMYTMNCFKLPDSLCNELNSLIRNFWWGQQDKERKLAWLAWEKMCTPKAEGGMGFKDLKAFNLALLAKQGWWLIQNTESLAHRVLKARYFLNSNFLEAQIGKKPSYTWRSLMDAKEVLRRGLRWNIGNGRRAKIWADRWIPILNSFMVASPKPQNFEGELVETLLDCESEQGRSQDFLHGGGRFSTVMIIIVDRKEIKRERLACTAWCIWKNRNTAKFEGKIKQAKEIVSEVNALVEDFKGQPEASRQRAPSRIVGWSPPREGWFKVNVDGALFKELGSCEIGVVIRNERGLLMGAMSKKLDLPLGALEVEAKAFEEGIQLAGDLGLRNIVMEGDAKMVTDALAGRCSPPRSIQMIIEGFRRWSLNVHAWQVTHVCRTGNFAAHLMARNAKLVNDSIVWVEDTPPIIECQVTKDVSGLDLVSF